MTASTHDGLRVTGLHVHFGAVRAVDGVDLSVAPGEVIALLGPSGCGKTTLLRTVAGFERPVAGEIAVGSDVVEGPNRHVPPHRRPVGLVFQEYALFPHKTVADNITFGLERGPGRAERLRQMLSLGELQGLERRYPHQLSGGQQQRVAVLRSLAPRPRLLLLDEPFSNLDPSLRAELRGEVARLLRAEGATAVLVTHDRADALATADRIAVMEAGRILQCDTPEGLYYRPTSEGAARFGGEVQYLDGRAKDGAVETALGALRLATDGVSGPCRVLVRPEWVTPCPGGTSARVESVALEGAVLRCRLSIPGGACIEMAVTAGNAVRAGETLQVGVHVAVPGFAP